MVGIQIPIVFSLWQRTTTGIQMFGQNGVQSVQNVSKLV